MTGVTQPLRPDELIGKRMLAEMSTLPFGLNDGQSGFHDEFEAGRVVDLVGQRRLPTGVSPPSVESTPTFGAEPHVAV